MKVKFKIRVFSNDYTTEFVITPEDDGTIIGNNILQLEGIEIDRSGGEVKLSDKKKGAAMEELQKTLVTIIGKQLESDSKNIQLLDVLNRLLGTVSNYLLNKKD